MFIRSVDLPPFGRKPSSCILSLNLDAPSSTKIRSLFFKTAPPLIWLMQSTFFELYSTNTSKMNVNLIISFSLLALFFFADVQSTPESDKENSLELEFGFFRIPEDKPSFSKPPQRPKIEGARSFWQNELENERKFNDLLRQRAKTGKRDIDHKVNKLPKA